MYVPHSGDVVWLHFDPQTGNEHKGHRPALVISPKTYNVKTSLMLCCPMTTKEKGYPFEVLISKNSIILSDQIKSLDWKARKVKFKDKISSDKLQEVCAKVKVLLPF